MSWSADRVMATHGPAARTIIAIGLGGLVTTAIVAQTVRAPSATLRDSGGTRRPAPSPETPASTTSSAAQHNPPGDAPQVLLSRQLMREADVRVGEILESNAILALVGLAPL